MPEGKWECDHETVHLIRYHCTSLHVPRDGVLLPMPPRRSGASFFSRFITVYGMSTIHTNLMLIPVSCTSNSSHAPSIGLRTHWVTETCSTRSAWWRIWSAITLLGSSTGHHSTVGCKLCPFLLTFWSPTYLSLPPAPPSCPSFSGSTSLAVVVPGRYPHPRQQASY